MEVRHRQRRNGLNGEFIAIIFIIIGFILIGKNIGIINYSLSRILISWQMLLIALGVITILKKQYTGGIILVGIGSFFIVRLIPGFGHIWVENYWPLIFIAIGIAIILGRNEHREFYYHKKIDLQETPSNTSEDGFFNMNNSFGSTRQTVLDPTFKGAVIRNSFGGTILDLRRTNLELNETYIDIDSSFGGVEIYIPESWMVKSIVKNSFSGFVDKRYHTIAMDSSKILVIRGSIAFSGLEIKG